ncbi:hydroxyacylglutathione hydrolase [Corallincola platygyrae]|uniref:Hydroxyacylglutathione hydrolase n=1 Tax=Corallincola platygyrae TaxID=1193278 RepID=A0ABW4XSD9_9GAMM
MIQISPISAFNDNYIWLIESDNKAIVVDPGDASPVINTIEERGLQLVAILLTHHHADHVGGINQLKQTYSNVKVFGPVKEATDYSDIQLDDGDAFPLPGISTLCRVYAVPGHTLGHIAYHIGDHLFCGDTLFSGGCGRLFEGTAEQMHHSLQTLANLPADTKVYPAHEYTLANLRFAQTVEPDNQALATHFKSCESLRENGQPTLPSTIETENAINPFLRVDQITVVQSVSRYLEKSVSAPTEVFAGLRGWKDNF